MPDDGVALAVSHGAAIRTAIGALLGWPPEQTLSLRGMENCGYAILRRPAADAPWRLHAYNRTVPVSAGRGAADVGPAPVPFPEAYSWVWGGSGLCPAGTVAASSSRAGARTLGRGVVPGVITQERRAYVSAEPLLDAYTEATGLTEVDARTLLAKFGLGADQVARACTTLSPGERTRAHLAELQARGVNLLVLDEPTNHLDLEAVEQLEQALAGYDGTLIVVSHDRRFLEAVAPRREVRLE